MDLPTSTCVHSDLQRIFQSALSSRKPPGDACKSSKSPPSQTWPFSQFILADPLIYIACPVSSFLFVFPFDVGRWTSVFCLRSVERCKWSSGVGIWLSLRKPCSICRKESQRKIPTSSRTEQSKKAIFRRQGWLCLIFPLSSSFTHILFDCRKVWGF
jgi:hypothetical protein